MSRQQVIVVGGGVLGTMHAVEARRGGFDVLHIEADAGPRRASCRNFGLVWVSGRAPGTELTLAVRARELWEEHAHEVKGLGYRPDGSLTVAADERELAVMAELASQRDATARQVEVLDSAEVRRVNPAITGEIAGALWCLRDAVVEPGQVLGAFRKHLGQRDGYSWLPDTRVVDVCEAVVTDHRGESHHAERILLCIGDQLKGIGGAVGADLDAAPIRRCRLQMMQTAPDPERLTTAIADGDSLRYYPAFDLASRSELPPPSQVTAAWAMQLLLVQRASGGLTIGDTHVYDEPFDFAVEESAYDDLRARAERILGRPIPPVERRWAGVYSAMTDGRIYYRSEVLPGVEIVTAPAGRGMTLSPAIAEETFRGP
jgi:FAD dependent oxidoreductase TIGR03364